MPPDPSLSLRGAGAARARIWRRVEGAGRRVALTVDDCDDAGTWARTLEAMALCSVAASFFPLGIRVRSFPELARRTLAAGHEVGSHGFDHARLPGLSFDDVRRRLDGDRAVWWRVARATPGPYLRPPFGAVDDTARRAAAATGYDAIVLWDVDPLDWTLPGTDEIIRRVLDAVRPGSIVELHAVEQTADALPSIIEELRRRKLEPSTVGTMLARASGAARARVP